MDYILVRTRNGGSDIKISREDFEKMMKAQRYVCAICHKPCRTERRLAVDHCHKTGKIRGLLCFNCNTHLGWVDIYRDEIDKYLSKEDTGIVPLTIGTKDQWYNRGKNLCKHPENCLRNASSYGWCRLHWDRIKIHGVPGPVLPITPKEVG